MTLGKTQVAILIRAARNPYGRTSVISGFITSRRRDPKYGRRESDAAIRLVQAGLLEFLGADKSQRHLCNGFGVDHSYDKSYKITNAGREVVENLPK